MGTILSGGQKQRVFLARALYARPKVLLLDEATSSLDISKEKDVSNAIKQLAITRIIIAHRRETIESTDRVLEVVAGTVHDREGEANMENLSVGKVCLAPVQ